MLAQVFFCILTYNDALCALATQVFVGISAEKPSTSQQAQRRR